jgi:cell division protein FtsL
MPKHKPRLKHKLSTKNIAHFSAISKVNLLAVALIFVAIGTIVLKDQQPTIALSLVVN